MRRITMNVSEMDEIGIDDPRAESITAPPDRPASARLEQLECEQCGAPVDRLQRYCVSCGAHRRHVPDPAGRYLAQSSARARVGAAPRPAVRRSGGITPVLALVLVLLAIGVGFALARSTDGGTVTVTSTTSADARPPASGHTNAGLAAARKLQHSTGSSYIRQSQQLGNSVSIP
jgi:hypothetical protein